MKKSLLIAAGILSLTAVNAQKSKYIKAPTLGINFSLKDFKTPMLVKESSLPKVIQNSQWTKVTDMAPGMQVTYTQGIFPHLDYAINLNGTFVNYPYTNTATTVYDGSDKFLMDLDANLHLKLLTDNYTVVPYASVGAGVQMLGGKQFAAYMPLGLGLQVGLGQGHFLNITAKDHIKVTDMATTNYNYTIGFSAPICERTETAKPTAVLPPAPIAAPKPKDSDNDGVIDSEDKCPNVAGLAKYGGCPIPDTDGDGINDEKDKCPNQKGIAKYAGCPIPDTDGDGINDEEDKCPTVAGLARYNGCPIPDSDNDGVNDEDDKCPHVFGTKANKGCPDLKEQYQFDANNVQFATSSDKFTKTAITEMNKLVVILKEHAELNKISISGHTDNTGKATSNQTLSEKRAKAVYNYLLSKGIAAERLSHAGFGDTKPVADNTTAEGKAKNRRVEFSISE